MMSRTSQMRQADGGEESGCSNCVPQVSQTARSPDSKFIVDFDTVLYNCCAVGIRMLGHDAMFM
jgi:hypothetical protein